MPAGTGPTGWEVVVRSYQLYIRVEGAWQWSCTLDAETHADAFRRVLLCLGRDDEHRPIRLEEDLDGSYRKPCRHSLSGNLPEKPLGIPLRSDQ